MNITQRIDIDEVINARAKFHLFYCELSYGLRYGEYWAAHLNHGQRRIEGNKLRQWISAVHCYEKLGIQHRSRNVMTEPAEGVFKVGISIRLYRDRAHFIRGLVDKWKQQRAIDTV